MVDSTCFSVLWPLRYVTFTTIRQKTSRYLNWWHFLVVSNKRILVILFLCYFWLFYIYLHSLTNNLPAQHVCSVSFVFANVATSSAYFIVLIVPPPPAPIPKSHTTASSQLYRNDTVLISTDWITVLPCGISPSGAEKPFIKSIIILWPELYVKMEMIKLPYK